MQGFFGKRGPPVSTGPGGGRCKKALAAPFYTLFGPFLPLGRHAVPRAGTVRPVFIAASFNGRAIDKPSHLYYNVS